MEASESDVSALEGSHQPQTHQEVVVYDNGESVLLITGEKGAKFDWQGHKWSPLTGNNDGIVTTSSGNEYYVSTTEDGSYVVNTRETARTGKLVAIHTQEPAELPPVEFGRPWVIPNFRTTEVESVQLRYKSGATGRRVEGALPTLKYRRMLDGYINARMLRQ